MTLTPSRSAVLCLCLYFLFRVSLWAQTAPAAAAPAPAAFKPLSKFAQDWNAVFSFDALSGTGWILRGQELVRFKSGYDGFILGTSRMLRAAPVESPSGTLVMQHSTALAIETWFNERDVERKSKFSVAMVIIDPGHGGKDPGAIGEHGATKSRIRVVEKDVALKIAQDIYARLKARWPERNILITRPGDTYPTLDERVAMANGHDLTMNEAVIFVSIHANASFNKDAEGFEVWYLNPSYRRSVVDGKRAEGLDKDILPIINSMLEEEYTTESVFLATTILNGLSESIGSVSTNRGLRPEEWFVVRNARMPSVLVEVGFVTNEDEARLLSDPGHLQKLGDGIYNGIVGFVDYFEHRRGSVSP